MAIEVVIMYFIALFVELAGIIVFILGLRKAKRGERLRLIGSLLIIVGSLIWAKVIPILVR